MNTGFEHPGILVAAIRSQLSVVCFIEMNGNVLDNQKDTQWLHFDSPFLHQTTHPNYFHLLFIVCSECHFLGGRV